MTHMRRTGGADLASAIVHLPGTTSRAARRARPNSPTGHGDFAAFVAIILHPEFYLSQTNLSDAEIGDPVRHFLEVGAERGLSPTPLFDTHFYLSGLSPAEQPLANPVRHYFEVGAKAALSPHLLFDVAYYSGQSGPIAGETPLSHYLRAGWRSGLSPHPLFDPEYYVRINDVEPAGEAPLVHYLMRETYDSLPHYLFSDSVYIASAERLDETAPSDRYGGGPPLVHFVRHGARHDVNPHPLFNADYYRDAAMRHAEDTGDHALLRSVDSSTNLLLHYLQRGAELGLSPSPFFDPRYVASQIRKPVDGDILRFYLMPEGFSRLSPHPGIDLAHYAAKAAGFDQTQTPAILHLLGTPAEERISPHPFFDKAFYQSHNKDIGDTCPILHFLTSGIREDRAPNRFYSPRYAMARAPQTAFTVRSPLYCYLFNYLRHPRRIVIVSHDASRTGAPGLALRLTEDFSLLPDVECFVLLGDGGPRVDEFRRSAHTLVLNDGRFHGDRIELKQAIENLLEVTSGNPPKAALVNSAESRHFGSELHRQGVSVVSLVHEAAELYEIGAFEEIYEASRKVVFPCRDMLRRARAAGTAPADKTMVRGQGLVRDSFGTLSRANARELVCAELKLPKDALLVLGCGTVDYRKGADLFVATAMRFLDLRAQEQKVHFVWVGAGAEGNTTLPGFLKAEIRAAAREYLIHFIGDRADVERYFVASDIFLMTSRIDPFPGVVHEAMAAGLPSVVFEGSGGSPEMVGEGGISVPYGDSRAMCDALVFLADDPPSRARLGRRARERLEKHWCFDDYFAFVSDLVLGPSPKPARTGRRKTAEKAKRIVVPVDAWRRTMRDIEAEFLVSQLNEKGFAAELVITRGRFGRRPRGEVAPPVVPYRYLQPDAVAFVDGAWRTSAAEVMAALMRHLRRVEPCVLVTGFDELCAEVAPTLLPTIAAVGVVRTLADIQPIIRAANAYDWIVAASKRIAHELTKANPSFSDRVSVLPPGVSCRAAGELAPRRKPAKTAALNVCCVLDSVAAVAQVSMLLRLRERIERTGAELHLSVVDIGAQNRPLDDPYILSPESDAALFVRPQDRASISDLLAASDVCILLGDDDTTTPWLAWAMAQGCVPVGFADGDGIVKSGVDGIVVDYGDFEALAAALEALLKNPTHRFELARAANRRIASLRLRQRDFSNALDAVFDLVFADLRKGGHLRSRPGDGRPEPTAPDLPAMEIAWGRQLIR